MSVPFEPTHPALQAWLEYASQPAPDPAERQRLRRVVPPEVMHQWQRAQRLERCRDATQVGEAVTHASPSGRFRLSITVHSEGPRTWSYSKGRVFEGDRLIAEICRNFGHFPFAWVESHPSGHAYLFAGEDYQGQTVIELDTGRRADHLPPEAMEGRGFCWAAFGASPSGRTMAVDGCYWACPYELWFVDLSDPLAGLPVLAVIEDESTFEWLPGAPDTCRFTRNIEVYAPTGTRASDMSDAECEDQRRRQAAGEKALWRTERVTETWTRAAGGVTQGD